VPSVSRTGRRTLSWQVLAAYASSLAAHSGFTVDVLEKVRPASGLCVLSSHSWRWGEAVQPFDSSAGSLQLLVVQGSTTASLPLIDVVAFCQLRAPKLSVSVQNEATLVQFELVGLATSEAAQRTFLL
jgi:hypothetical protein